MRPRLELRVKQTTTVRTTIRQRLLITGSAVIFSAIVAASIFLYGSFGNNNKVYASLGNNMGFENGTSEWVSVQGTWSSNSTAAYVRSGSKSLKIAQANGLDGEINNASCNITVPATGTQYIIITAYAKGSDSQGKIRLGAINVASGNTTWATTHTAVSSSGFTMITGVVAANNGNTYCPTITTKREGGGTTTIYIDDVSFYCSTATNPDITAPTAPSSASIACNGASITLNWVNGTDSESGLAGVLILRQLNVQSNIPAVAQQTAYSTNPVFGPTAVGSWSVVYHGAVITSFTDNTVAAGVYTYLILNRDNADNYTAAANGLRTVVTNGTNQSSSVTSNTNVDGLYIAAGSTITVPSGNTLTIKPNSNTIHVQGTLVNSGSITNNAAVPVNMKNGSVYRHNTNGSSVPTATWEAGSTCEITGVTSTVPTNLNQSFHHFTWNAQNQSTALTLPDGFYVNGNATFTHTGGLLNHYEVKFSGTNYLRGNLYVSGNAKVTFQTGSHVHFDGTAQQSVESNGNVLTFESMTLNNSGGMLAGSDLKVNNICTLTQGLITAGSNEIYIQNPSTNALVYGNSSYVIGKLRREINGSSSTAYQFPIGTTSHRELVSVKPNSLTGVSNIYAKFSSTITGLLPNAATCIANGFGINTMLNCGFWTVEPDQQPSGGTYDITLHAKGATNPTAQPSTLAVIKRANSLLPWAVLGTTVPGAQSTSGGVSSVTCYGLTSFSDFGAGYGGYTLPITLSAFDVKPDENGNVVTTWITSSEINNAYFSLERSADAKTYEEIDQQEGAGTSTQMRNCFYTDANPLPGTSYYRLKQVDFDGKMSYSQIRVVTNTESAAQDQNLKPADDISVYPNPGHGVFNFTNVATDGDHPGASVLIFDMKGQMILKKTFAKDEAIQLDLTNQPPGAYMATIVDANEKTSFQRLIIQR